VLSSVTGESGVAGVCDMSRVTGVRPGPARGPGTGLSCEDWSDEIHKKGHSAGGVMDKR
jgi:hypothetical protein